MRFEVFTMLDSISAHLHSDTIQSGRWVQNFKRNIMPPPSMCKLDAAPCTPLHTVIIHMTTI